MEAKLFFCISAHRNDAPLPTARCTQPLLPSCHIYPGLPGYPRRKVPHSGHLRRFLLSDRFPHSQPLLAAFTRSSNLHWSPSVQELIVIGNSFDMIIPPENINNFILFFLNYFVSFFYKHYITLLNTKQIDCTRRIHRFYQYIMLYYIKHIQPYCRRHCIRPGKSLMSVRLTGDLSEVKHSAKLTKGVLKNESVSEQIPLTKKS